MQSSLTKSSSLLTSFSYASELKEKLRQSKPTFQDLVAAGLIDEQGNVMGDEEHPNTSTDEKPPKRALGRFRKAKATTLPTPSPEAPSWAWERHAKRFYGLAFDPVTLVIQRLYIVPDIIPGKERLTGTTGHGRTSTTARRRNGAAPNQEKVNSDA